MESDRKNMSTDQKLTPWFNGAEHKPARIGVYMLESMSGRLGYQKWHGSAWSSWYETAEAAGKAGRLDIAARSTQNDRWRGLSSKHAHGIGEKK